MLILIIIDYLVWIPLFIRWSTLIAHKEFIGRFRLRFLVNHLIVIRLLLHYMYYLLLTFLGLRHRLMLRRHHESDGIILGTIL